MQWDHAVKTAFGILGGIAGFLWGSLDGLLIALFCFMGFDFITGLIVAGANREINSEVCFRGLAKKLLIMVIIAIAHLLDTQIFMGESSVCRSSVICFYLANEGLSITENCGKLGLPMPKKIKRMLKQLRDDNDKEDDNGNADH